MEPETGLQRRRVKEGRWVELETIGEQRRESKQHPSDGLNQDRGTPREREGRSSGNDSRQRGPRDAQRTLASMLKGQQGRSVDFLPVG